MISLAVSMLINIFKEMSIQKTLNKIWENPLDKYVNKNLANIWEKKTLSQYGKQILNKI